MSGKRNNNAAPLLLLPMPGNEGFARQLGTALQAETGEIECRRFPDGETYLRLLSSVSGRRVAIVSTLAQPDPTFLALAFTAEAARKQGAAGVYLVAPYLAYMRQDKVFKSGEAVSSETFSRLISTLFDGLVTVDPHLHRRHALSEIYSIPSVVVQAAPALSAWVSSHVPRPILIGPDSESAQWVAAVAERIDARWTVMTKTRRGDYDVSLELPDLARYQHYTPVLLDDIASSGRTMIAAAGLLAKAGFGPPTCVVVHPLFAEDAYARLHSVAERVVSCDSVPHSSNAIGLAPFVATALAKLSEDPSSGD